jgi:hypothetical protein
VVPAVLAALSLLVAPAQAVVAARAQVARAQAGREQAQAAQGAQADREVPEGAWSGAARVRRG